LVDHLSVFDPAYTLANSKAAAALVAQGVPGAGADGLIYGQLLRQSRMLAFNDVFFVSSVLMLSVLILVFFMQRAPAGGR
jgi:DHA2 family multidrug resistance protein